jgi:hydrogenase maturation protease
LIVVDTIRTGCCAPGTILRLSLDDFELAQHLSSPHDIGFKELIELGRRLALNLPSEILIYALEAQDTETFGERLTSEIAKAVPQVANMIVSEQLEAAYSQ